MCYPEKRASYPETGVPKRFIGPHIKQGSKGVYECHYEHASECQYLAENHDTVATHICGDHMGICVGYQYCPKNLGQVIHGETILRPITQTSIKDNHYGPPLDLAEVKLEEVDVIDI